MTEQSALYQGLLAENTEAIEGFEASGATFRDVQEVVFSGRFPDRPRATAARRELAESHPFSVEDLVFTKNVPGDAASVDCVIAVLIPINAEKITYFEHLLRHVGAKHDGADYSWEIQP